MIIGVDGNEANVEKKVGVSVYTLKLLEYFQENASADTQFEIFLREKPGISLPKETKYFRYSIVEGKILWSQIFLPYYLHFKTKIDVFFAPAHYAPRFCPVPIVLTIHDLSFFYYPNEFRKKDLYQLKNWTEYSIKKAHQIISVSKTTKKDIRKFYDIPEEKISIIYNGFEKHEGDSRHISLEQYGTEKNKYILFVGTLQPRKNIPYLIKGFAKFKNTNPDYKLIIVGKQGWLFDDIYAEVIRLNLEKSVLFTGYLADDELIKLYKNAFCLVLPSLYEGFGIPVLEAMSNGCPVIASHSSSLPEIGGDACLYIDPTDIQDLIDKLNDLSDNKELRDSLIKKGSERIKNFSWNTCALETLKILTGIKS
jgi:glycosyltransferase involved in cell wall biosynthesis